MRNSPRRCRGLATVLALLAIVGFLTAFLLYNGLTAVSKRLDANAANLSAFKSLDEALGRYVMLNQRLPCPSSGTAHTGIADPDSAVATCNSPSGVVPWATLGLSQRDATDSWGRYIAYRVYDGATGFTRANGMTLTNCLDEEVTTVYALSGAGSTCNPTTHENTISDFFASKGLTVNDRGTANTKVAYALISMGESGFGAYYPGGNAPTTSPSSSSKEFLNAGSGGTYWITTPSGPSVPAEDAGHFDDVVSYAYAGDVARAARFARPWGLNTVFTHTNVGVTTSNYNSGNASYKIATSGGPVWVTAAADSARVICGTSTSPEGIAPCTTQTNGNNLLASNSNERLTFDFRVTRRYAIIQLTDFRASGGGDNERAQITFYKADGTQVDQHILTACATSGSERIGQYTLTATGDFTKIEVRALTKTGGGGSDLGVSAIAACKLQSDCSSTPVGWTAPIC